MILSVLLAFSLVGCGGGGDSDNNDDNSNVGNIAPIANAGVDQSVNELSLVNLSGSGSDTDGSITTFQWQQISGTASSLDNPTRANASFNAPDVSSSENLVFRLTVTDNDGAAGTDDITITVNPIATANQPPSANAGGDQIVEELAQVTLSGSGNDSDGTVDSYAWQQLTGTTVALMDGDQPSASFEAPDVTGSDELQFRLTVTDDDGDSDSDDVTITVNECGATAQHSMARANSYDDGWQAAWVAKAQTVLNTPIAGVPKTAGKVLQVGDSMTYSYAYGLWARNPNGGSVGDTDTTVWMRANVGDGSNGFDWSSDGTTAQNNGSWFHGFVGSIFSNSELNDAQFAIIMFNIPDVADPQDLSVVLDRVNEFLAVGILPIVSTIPPRTDFQYNEQYAYPYNAALHAFAEQQGLPIIDYAQEILLRRPNNTWVDTLISGDGVHPSGERNSYFPDSDPYLPGGDAASHTTGDAALNSGYLLRTWLAVQKMKEIKRYVVDGEPIPAPSTCN